MEVSVVALFCSLPMLLGYSWGILWRIFLCSAAMNGVSNELMFQWIKNASDNGEGVFAMQNKQSLIAPRNHPCRDN